MSSPPCAHPCFSTGHIHEEAVHSAPQPGNLYRDILVYLPVSKRPFPVLTWFLPEKIRTFERPRSSGAGINSHSAGTGACGFLKLLLDSPRFGETVRRLKPAFTTGKINFAIENSVARSPCQSGQHRLPTQRDWEVRTAPRILGWKLTKT